MGECVLLDCVKIYIKHIVITRWVYLIGGTEKMYYHEKRLILIGS